MKVVNKTWIPMTQPADTVSLKRTLCTHCLLHIILTSYYQNTDRSSFPFATDSYAAYSGTHHNSRRYSGKKACTRCVSVAATRIYIDASSASSTELSSNSGVRPWKVTLHADHCVLLCPTAQPVLPNFVAQTTSCIFSVAIAQFS